MCIHGRNREKQSCNKLHENISFLFKQIMHILMVFNDDIIQQNCIFGRTISSNMKNPQVMYQRKLLSVSILSLFLIFTSCSVKTDKDYNTLINKQVLGKIIPKNSSQVISSPFGIQAGTAFGIKAGTMEDSLLYKAAQIGVKWTRLLAGWEDIETEKGAYNWKETDEAIDAVLKYGITPFVTITNGNRIYTGTGNYDDPKLAAIYGESPAPPVGSQAETDAWLKFVGAVVERYKDKIKYWEIWNEPNHRKYWGAPPNAEDYGKLVKVTVDKIRAIHPDAIIIAGSTAGIKPDYNDTFLSHCDPEKLDIISFHQYNALPEKRAFRIDEFLEVLYKHNPDFEIWQGECGFPSSSRTTGFRANAPWGLNIQAKWLLRQSIVDTYYCRASMSNFFLLADNGSMTPNLNRPEKSETEKIFGFPERNGSRVHYEGVNEKCILFRENNKPKPAYYAYQNLCAVWAREYKPHPVEYNVKVLDQGVFYGIGEYEDVFPSVPLVATYSSENGDKLLAWWLPWNMQENLAKLGTVKIQLEGINFKDPVMLDPLTGEVYEIEINNTDEGSVIEEVVIADYPFIIVERETIEFN